MEEENAIEVAPSEESGNVPAEAPSEQPVETSTEAEKPSEESSEPPKGEPELYELPDGRKVDAATLSHEFKENFLPEFTRKSQALAELEKGKINQTPEEKPYRDPNWTPQTYAELIEIAKQEVKGDLEQQEKARIEARQALENAIVTELSELKKTDPNLNENALFLHANEYREKYGVAFPNLTAAYKHMKDVAELTKNVQNTTAKNIAKRADPVSTQTAPTGQRPDPSQFENAIGFLRSLK